MLYYSLSFSGGLQVSLSNCQLEAIDPSIKACTELEQLRLAHNDIKVHIQPVFALELGVQTLVSFLGLVASKALFGPKTNCDALFCCQTWMLFASLKRLFLLSWLITRSFKFLIWETM